MNLKYWKILESPQIRKRQSKVIAFESYNEIKLSKTETSLKDMDKFERVKKMRKRQLSANGFYKWYNWLINVDKNFFIVVLNIKYEKKVSHQEKVLILFQS